MKSKSYKQGYEEGKRIGYALGRGDATTEIFDSLQDSRRPRMQKSIFCQRIDCPAYGLHLSHV